jgi:hypothetical protein
MAENPPALERWLEVATKNLAEEGKARVRAEIEAHYWEAVEEKLRHGDREEEAHTKALNSLGDPGEAGRCARKTYLTIDEVNRIRVWRGEVEDDSWKKLCFPTDRTWIRIFDAAALLAVLVIIYICLTSPFKEVKPFYLTIGGLLILLPFLCGISYGMRLIQKFAMERFGLRKGILLFGVWAILGPLIMVQFCLWGLDILYGTEQDVSPSD